MKRLGGIISEIIIDEYGPDEFLRRLSDPYFFQAFGCVLGFDFHSSGLTATTIGALKESLNSKELGIAFCGGKGRASRKAPQEIVSGADRFSLSSKRTERMVYASRMSAKVDSTAIQDGYQLYHHCFIFTGKGDWCVIQQGMNPENRYARRYHWLSRGVRGFVEEPHEGICCNRKEGKVLDMTSGDSREARNISLDLVRGSPSKLRKSLTGQSTLIDFAKQIARPSPISSSREGNCIRELHMPRSHYIINMDKRNLETLQKAHEIQPESYEELLGIGGMGPKSVRALALISDLVYGKPASWQDPVRFSFCHGGKDGVPYEIDRNHYDKTIEVLKTGVEQARLDNRERLAVIKRLEGFM